MPGILPMKLIKCGNSQTRIAQACDRCRSKKIRCDGSRPCCTQCANVGFECTTSDKLSRRAFPRGYTESLEERVRQLEGEVRVLKELLDAKEEQLDMISRIHSFSPYSPPPSSTSSGPYRSGGGVTRASSVVESPSNAGNHDVQDDCFTIQEPAFLVNDGAGRFYLGESSGLPFVDFFKRTLQGTGRLKHDFDIGSFFMNQSSGNTQALQQAPSNAPSRLSSDHLITAFFQQYHPLFPILHRPSFLKQYEKLISCSEISTVPSKILSKYSLVQLYLVFAIAARNSEMHNKAEVKLFDIHWRWFLDAILLDSSLETVQCLVLAQLYCFVSSDYERLAQYKSLCVAAVLRLGLNRAQRDFTNNAVLTELNKRVFWCVYCLDSFSAAMLGLPRLLKDEDISTEYPSDIDDEYITQDGFLSALPGDFTKISSSIALFRCSRVLAKVLDSVYPTTLAHDQSFRRLKELEDELDTWKAELAPHLRLDFVNGVPATNVVHSRSPLLVLAYHFTRVLIHRPVIRSNEAAINSSPSFLAMAESSKHIIQIIQLLSERKLGFSFCLDRNYLLVISGFAILYGTVHYQQKGSLAKESEILISRVIHELERAGYNKVNDFRKVAETIVHVEKLVTSDLGTVTASKVIPSPTNTVAAPISPPDPIRPEGHSFRRKMTLITNSVAVKICPQRKDLSAAPLNGIRRANDQSMASGLANGPNSIPPRRNSFGVPHNGVGRIQTAHIQPYESTSNLDSLQWAYDGATQAALPIQKQDRSKTITGDDWTRLLAFVDATQGANIYGGGDHTYIQNSAVSSAPIITGLGSGADGWGLDCYIANNSYDATDQMKRMHPYSATPPSVSSFSSLNEEGLVSDDGMNLSVGSPLDLADLLVGEDDLRLAVQAVENDWA
ncbi:fungal-specific transcription factor domain-containing protein [Terfezia claveryi]|nr:fungal-specific transcription factor domain-containing protein [Terfezia claveryi]